MYARCLYILIVLTRLAASTMIVPVALAAGMMMFPTTCACGAEHPHDHPLYGLAGHHHGEQRTTTGGADTEFIRAGTHGITMQTAVESASPSLTATHPTALRIQSLPRASMPIATVSIPDGTSATLDVPPPRA